MRAATIALLLVLALAGRAHAGEQDRQEKCISQAELAERIMRHRQDTNDLESSWRMAGLIRNIELSRIAQGLVQAAYREPRRASEEDRDGSAREFAATTMAACLAGMDATDTARPQRAISRWNGAGEWIRTTDLLITNQLLCRLSYPGTKEPRKGRAV
jgi:hypothetical protein